MNVHLDFPVLCVGAGGDVEAVKDRDELETCGVAALRKGYFNRVLLVDSTGKAWKVRDAKKLGGAGRFWGWSLLYSRRVHVDLTLESAGSYDVSAFQDLVSNSIKRHPELWESVSEIVVRVRTATTITDVIQIFDYD